MKVIGKFWVLCVCLLCDYFLVWMRVIEIFGGMGKNFRVCGYGFLFIWKLQVNKVPHKYLLYTSIVTHVKTGFVMIKIRKRNWNYTKKSEIIVITLENLEELLIVFAICAIKYLKKFWYLFIIVLHMMMIL